LGGRLLLLGGGLGASAQLGQRFGLELFAVIDQGSAPVPLGAVSATRVTAHLAATARFDSAPWLRAGLGGSAGVTALAGHAAAAATRESSGTAPWSAVWLGAAAGTELGRFRVELWCRAGLALSHAEALVEGAPALSTGGPWFALALQVEFFP